MAQNLERQAELIAALAASFRVEADQALFLGYELGLIGVHTEDLERAVATALQTCRFMPTPAELRGLAGAALGVSIEYRALLAWQAFREAWRVNGAWGTLDFDDPVINATVRMLGGLQRVDEIEGDQFYVWYRKEFEKTYAALCEAGVTAELSGPLMGNLESLGSGSDCSGSDESTQVKVLTGLPPLKRLEQTKQPTLPAPEPAR